MEPPLTGLYRFLYNAGMKTLPLTEARKDLSKIVDEVSAVHEHVKSYRWPGEVRRTVLQLEIQP